MSFNDILNKTNIIFFNIVGTFGNICLILMTTKSKDLHFKCGYILAMLSLFNVVLLWTDLWALYLQFTNIHDGNPQWCLAYNLVYFVLQGADLTLWAVTGVDRLLSIYKPVWYMRVSTPLYLFCLSAPMCFISITLLVWGSVKSSGLNTAMPPFCWLDPLPVVTFFDLYTNGCRIVTVFFYAVVYYRIRRIKILKEDSALLRKQISIIGSLVVIVALNGVLVVLTVIIRSFRKVSWLEGVVTVSETTFNIFVELIWAADFYVYYWRSPQYRRAFKEVILRRKPQSAGSLTVVPLGKSSHSR